MPLYSPAPKPEMEEPSGLIDDVNTDFDLAHDPIAGSVVVFKNGLQQLDAGDDYTLSGRTISFATAPSENADNPPKDEIRVAYLHY